MSSGISTLCRNCPRLVSRRAGQAVARSVSTQHRPRTTARPTYVSLRQPYSTTPAGKPNVANSLSNNERKKPGDPGDRRRNRAYRQYYQHPSEDRVALELKGAFVPSQRQYPSEQMTLRSEKERVQEARTLAGDHRIWEDNLRPDHFLVKTLDWQHIHTLLKQTTPRSSKDDNRVSAMRIIVSGSLIDSKSLGKGVNFISTVTGILEKLRVDPDVKPSDGERQSFILRGGRKSLSQTADELSKLQKGIEIFELGDVATTDYHTKQLWPAAESLSKDDQASVNKSTRDRLWLYPEPEPHYITKRFSDIPKPEQGNPEAFESYITEMVSAQMRREHVLPLYYEGYNNGHGKNIDVEAERARLIVEVFEDPANRSCITNASLKRALHYLSRNRGHRNHAKSLFWLATESGLPMDTEIYNIILEGIASRRDFRDFYKWVSRMRRREFEPNARTWLLFLRLVKKDDERRQIVSSMFERNLLTHQSVRRGVAAITAPMDAHQAFRAGKDLKEFVREHNDRFGYRWYTSEAMIGIVREYFHYFSHRPISATEWAFLVEQRFENGERMDTQTMNALLELCAENKDWVGAIWCVDHMTNHQTEFDEKSYMTMLRLACSTSNYFALTAVLFHGAQSSNLYYGARSLVKSVLLSDEATNPWRGFEIPLFTESLAGMMRAKKAASTEHLGYQIFDLYRKPNPDAQHVPAEPLALSLLSALSLHHEAASLAAEGSSVNQLALEIPMKKSGTRDDDVVTTYRFDTAVEMKQKSLAEPQPQREIKGLTGKTVPGLDEPTQGNREINDGQEAEHELDDTTQAAREARDEYLASIAKATMAPEKPGHPGKSPDLSSRFFQSGTSPFQSDLNTAIPKATPSTKPKRKLGLLFPPQDFNYPRTISQEEEAILKSIKGTLQADEATRIAEEREDYARWSRKEVREKMGLDQVRPWLRDDFASLDLQRQHHQTAEWLFHRYKDIKAQDRRNIMYPSQERLVLERASREKMAESRMLGILGEGNHEGDEGEGND